MEKSKIKELFLDAENNLSKATNELNRPAFDVVKYAVCVFGRTAIHRYFYCLYAWYALQNNEQVKDDITIQEMLDYCRKYNTKLSDRSFFALHCMDRDVLQTEELFYCNDLNQVKTCSDIAKDVRELVIEEVWNGSEPS